MGGGGTGMSDTSALWIYALPLGALMAGYAWRQRHVHARSVSLLEAAREAGLHEPPSLHPKIDTARCIGCGSCVSACPEAPQHQVLGLIHGKAALVSPSECIGHGACRSACPVERDHAGVRHRDAGRRYPAYQSGLPDQRAGALHRR